MTELLLTCEHARNAVPPEWLACFPDAGEVLASHEGWDPGALPVARDLARTLGATLFEGDWTRLLIDLNRSPDNPRRFSRFTRGLPASSRARLDHEIHGPWQGAVADWIAERLAAGSCVLHVCVHSFKPVFRGLVRRTDVGILHVRTRDRESAVSRTWQRMLRKALPAHAIHRNLPYRGDSDGHVPLQVWRFPSPGYCGIELELNQRLLVPDHPGFPTLVRALGETLGQLTGRLDR